MFTLDTIFDQLFPLLSDVSWDLGTVLTGMVFLWILAEGATLLWEMMDNRLQGHIAGRNADRYLGEARRHEELAMGFAEGSVERDFHERLQSSYLGDAVRSKRRKRIR